ncbi:HPr family phosphocarrier protein, partial [Clostridiaceae bacterium]|nr:HPr family phosphocarrier protein [Clostridiaceae bacterium]
MKQLEFTIVDPLGIHARPAGQLCKAVGTMGSAVKLAAGEKEVDARRI